MKERFAWGKLLICSVMTVSLWSFAGWGLGEQVSVARSRC